MSNSAQRSILLVEDNPDDIELTLIGLQRARTTRPIVSIRDGVEALDYLRRDGMYTGRTDPDPAVIILDVKLPRLDGLQVLKSIRGDKRFECVPVVVLSSSRLPADLSNAYRFGANAYVTKPIEARHFMQVVKDLGDFWGAVNEVPDALATGPRDEGGV